MNKLKLVIFLVLLPHVTHPIWGLKTLMASCSLTALKEAVQEHPVATFAVVGVTAAGCYWGWRKWGRRPRVVLRQQDFRGDGGGCSSNNGTDVCNPQQSCFLLRSISDAVEAPIFAVVCDGYGGFGGEVSQLVCKQFENLGYEISESQIKSFYNSIGASLLSNKHAVFSGSACATAILFKDRVLVAHIGNVKCMLVRGDQVVQATINHDVKDSKDSKDSKEWSRIKTDFPTSRFLVGDRSIPCRELVGGLSLTRSFGSTQFQSDGLIVEPEISVWPVLQDDYVILCNDSIFNASQGFSTNEAIAFLVKRYADQKMSADTIAQELVKEAGGFRGNDITAVVVRV